MTRIIRAPRAKQDIRYVLEYTKERWGSSQALQYAQLIKKAEIAIANDPSRGKSCIRERPDVLAYPIRYPGRPARHILFYRIGASNTVEIVRLLHDAMDFRHHILSVNFLRS